MTDEAKTAVPDETECKADAVARRNSVRDRLPLHPSNAAQASAHGWSERDYKEARCRAMYIAEKRR